MATAWTCSYKCCPVRVLKTNVFAIYGVWWWLLLCVNCSTTLPWAKLPPDDYNLKEKPHPPANTKIYHLFPPYSRQSMCDHIHFRMLLLPPMLSSVSPNVHHLRAKLPLRWLFSPLGELGGRAQKSFCGVMTPSCCAHNTCVKETVRCKSKLAYIGTLECSEYKYATCCSRSCLLKRRKCQKQGNVFLWHYEYWRQSMKMVFWNKLWSCRHAWIK